MYNVEFNDWVYVFVLNDVIGRVGSNSGLGYKDEVDSFHILSVRARPPCYYAIARPFATLRGLKICSKCIIIVARNLCT